MNKLLSQLIDYYNIIHHTTNKIIVTKKDKMSQGVPKCPKKNILIF